jgi:hypothetical protein
MYLNGEPPPPPPPMSQQLYVYDFQQVDRPIGFDNAYIEAICQHPIPKATAYWGSYEGYNLKFTEP